MVRIFFKQDKLNTHLGICQQNAFINCSVNLKKYKNLYYSIKNKCTFDKYINYQIFIIKK